MVNPIFDWKALVFVGIVIFVLTVLFTPFFVPVDAYENGCNDFSHSGLYCHLKSIFNQNQQIIEKLDWNNCAISFKSSSHFYGDKNVDIIGWEEVAHNNQELEEFCGERP